MRDVKIEPIKTNKTKIILDLIKEKYKHRKKKEKLFGGNPTEYFRKMREEHSKKRFYEPM